MRLIPAVLITAFLAFALTWAANDWGVATFGMALWTVVAAAVGCGAACAVTALVLHFERRTS